MPYLSDKTSENWVFISITRWKKVEWDFWRLRIFEINTGKLRDLFYKWELKLKWEWKSKEKEILISRKPAQIMKLLEKQSFSAFPPLFCSKNPDKIRSKSLQNLEFPYGAAEFSLLTQNIIKRAWISTYLQFKPNACTSNVAKTQYYSPCKEFSSELFREKNLFDLFCQALMPATLRTVSFLAKWIMCKSVACIFCTIFFSSRLRRVRL